jgi:acyl carrier protein
MSWLGMRDHGADLQLRLTRLCTAMAHLPLLMRLRVRRAYHPSRQGAVRTIEKHVLAIVAKKFNARVQLLTPRTDLRRDLGADSLALVELVMLLESEFQVDIPDEDLTNMATIRQLVEYLRDETNAASRACDIGWCEPLASASRSKGDGASPNLAIGEDVEQTAFIAVAPSSIRRCPEFRAGVSASYSSHSNIMWG